MLRVVADTNIYVSAFAFGGPISKIFESAQAGDFELYISKFIIEEIKRTLGIKFHWPEEQLVKLINNILGFTYLIEPREQVLVITKDPSDNRILECALEAVARIIITGDRHLRDLNHFKHIEIVTPRNFLDYLELHKGFWN